MSESATLLARIGGAGHQLSVADYARLARELRTTPSLDGLLALRVGILSSCTMQFVDPFLRVEGVRRRLRVEAHYGPFGQFEQQLSDPASPLYAFQTDVLVLLMRPEDLDADTYARYYARHPSDGVLGRVVDRLANCGALFRERSAGFVLVANLAAPPRLPLGPFDANAQDSLTYALAQANAALRDRLADVPGTVVWDYAGLVRTAGAEFWSDPRLFALARIPVAHDYQPMLARQLARVLAGLVRPPAKCLVLDLDNTLWGGVIGDDGLEGIMLGDEYPGNAFKNFQRTVLGFADRGILLAVASKNDSAVVERALSEHPEMLIRPEHLSAVRTSWRPKSQMLREIAEELNIGLDALVLFDDSPAERAEVAANAPGVLQVEVPSDPLGYERALHDCGFFDAVALTREDRDRVQMYRQERAREVQQSGARTVEEFLADLDMVAEVGLVNEATLGRVAQLVGKTNQFNLTKRRHSQADIARMSRDPGCAVTYLRLRDRFGDLGLIAVGILAINGTEAVIDSFVMSCRAMGRQAEVALAAHLVEIARAAGCEQITGDYLPTARNGIVAELYPTLGFKPAGPLEGGGARFSLELRRTTIAWPSLIRREESGDVPPRRE